MKKILVVWIIVAVVLVGGLTFIGLNLKNKNKDYYDLEDKIADAAKGYFGQYPDQLPAAELIKTSVDLINANFLESFYRAIYESASDLGFYEEKCTGYVVIKKNYMFYDYFPYINCENYTTKGYDATKDKVES